MVLQASGSPLVSGSAGGQAGTVKVRTRKALTGRNGERIEAGAVLELPVATARELASYKLVEPVTEEPAAESADEVPAANPKKVKSNARK